jgi:hypothetical protein
MFFFIRDNPSRTLLRVADNLKTFVDMLWPGNCFDHNGSDLVGRICVGIANCTQVAAGTLRKNARYYHTIARCATGLLTKSTEVKTQAATIAKMMSNQGMYDEFTSVLGNSRSVWEKVRDRPC